MVLFTLLAVPPINDNNHDNNSDDDNDSTPQLNDRGIMFCCCLPNFGRRGMWDVVLPRV